MPEKWDDAREKRLLLEVIAITNPTVDGSAWTSVAAVMGDGVTAEACRQKFQGIKRALKSNRAPTTSATKTPSSKTPKTAPTTKTRKRKPTNSDDEEAPAKKPKREPTAPVGEVFKAESSPGNVDLENAALYDDDEDDAA